MSTVEWWHVSQLLRRQACLLWEQRSIILCITLQHLSSRLQIHTHSSHFRWNIVWMCATTLIRFYMNAELWRSIQWALLMISLDMGVFGWKVVLFLIISSITFPITLVLHHFRFMPTSLQTNANMTMGIIPVTFSFASKIAFCHNPS